MLLLWHFCLFLLCSGSFDHFVFIFLMALLFHLCIDVCSNLIVVVVFSLIFVHAHFFQCEKIKKYCFHFAGSFVDLLGIISAPDRQFSLKSLVTSVIRCVFVSVFNLFFFMKISICVVDIMPFTIIQINRCISYEMTH